MIIFLNFFRRFARRVWRSDIFVIVSLTALLILVGTVAYVRLEGWGWLDALYATVITITTVGYGDLSPQTANGRLFAIFFTFIAIGIAGYTISTFAAYLIESRTEKKAKYLRKRRMKRIEQLENHYILCGANLVGTRIAEEFYLAQAPYIIIDSDEHWLKTALLYSHPEYFQQKLQSLMDISEIDLSQYENRSLAEVGELLNTPYILDDPTDDNVLVRAGIARAAGLIAALADDRDNLAIVVGARALANRFNNPNLRIMARTEDGRFMRKLYLSGADTVRVPAVMSGLEMATHMMHPEIGNWWYAMMGMDKASTPSIQQQSVQAKPEWVGKTVSHLHQEAQLLTLAVKRADEFVSPPPASFTLQADDILILLAPQKGA
ncbi:MAG: potassium channel protein [Chloroflexota bacterium]